MTLGQACHRVLWPSPISVIPLKLHTLVLIYILLLQEGQTGDARVPSKKLCTFGNLETFDRKVHPPSCSLWNCAMTRKISRRQLNTWFRFRLRFGLCGICGWPRDTGRNFFSKYLVFLRSWGSSTGVATHYGLVDTGIQSLWGRDFPHSSRPDLGPLQPHTKWVPAHSWG
jgi:hypothetical protein